MKQRKQIIALVVLLAIAGVVWFYERDDSARASSGAFVSQNYQLLSVENPEIRWKELEASRKSEYKSSGRNPFSKVAAPPPTPTTGPNAPHPVHPYVKQGPPTDPPVPPFVPPGNLKFFGYGTVPNGTARRAFFTDGEEVYIVAEGETLQGRYRIVKVNNTNLDIQEVSTGRHATMPLTEEPASAGGPS
jgi:hypothetical protein